ncbi:uncharacterized protein B0I36DRAFT_354421 [Microdochium trichocladiopsis]|uniref:Alpha/Beta hydrolase protein n=1 Tax=Microdochium trichocladiopsis TaxID=1682393 RepID=A0A9P8XW54_9PEZI|nr:uncharacterized protein B0I36DRAFT_354421 [Microdochium trichocladiopsis]KAH7018109.1 hypothetical protein B0I36DRAFT_354421 [Microdochium trichocladiopsis]
MSHPPPPSAVPGPGSAPAHHQRPPAATPDATPGKIRFFGSQVGGESVVNYGYTDMPMKLLMWDMRNFFVYIWFLPWIVWPLNPANSGDFDELAFNRSNAWCIFVHLILIALQLGFIVALPFSLLFPLWIDALAIALFFTLNWAICLLLNGRTKTMVSDPKYAVEEDHPHEQWIFLNGVAAGEAWLVSNINRLALTFRRPVIGIHNRTSGILFDVVECLIQRNFGYATGDVREAYKVVKDKLYNPQYSKVVFILHSQGGIEGGLVLDWLLQEMPQDLLAKLEVYTFGNAANHFNNPHLHVKAQEMQEQHSAAALRHHCDGEAIPVTDSPVEYKSSASPTNTRSSKLADLAMTSSSTTNGDSNSNAKIQNRGTTTTTTNSAAAHVIPATSDRVIAHVEHYAHTTDFVALWGVLHFATAQMANKQLPRFIGRVFARTSPRGGHQFCQHYLDGMFPLELDPHGDGKNDFLGCAETNEFMESIVEDAAAGSDAFGTGLPTTTAATTMTAGPGGDGQQPSRPVVSTADARPNHTAAAATNTASKEQGEPWDLREDLATSLAMLLPLPDRAAVLPTAADTEVQFHGGSGTFGPAPSHKGPVRVKDLSRLWLYRNGRSPPDVPRGMAVGADGLARGRTL